MDMDALRAFRQNLEMLRDVEPAERFAYAMYQTWCIGSGTTVFRWDALAMEIRAGWRAAADFCVMYSHTMEIDAIVRGL